MKAFTGRRDVDVSVEPPVPVTDLDLTRYLAGPVTGGTPGKAVEGVQYRGWVAWFDENQAPVVGLFEAGTSYTMRRKSSTPILTPIFAPRASAAACLSITGRAAGSSRRRAVLAAMGAITPQIMASRSLS
ncbi:MAG: hypothetical protein LBR93_11875 [Treponema sp.]|nr:hypothetical protein [Treponema sp.]